MLPFARLRAALLIGSAVALPISQTIAARAAAAVPFPLQGTWINSAPAGIRPVIISARFVPSGAPDGPLEVRYDIQAFQHGQLLGRRTVIRSFGTTAVTVTLSPPCASSATVCIVRSFTRMTLARSGANLHMEAIVYKAVGTVGFPVPDTSYSETLVSA